MSAALSSLILSSTIIVVWRESFEAILIVGILYAALKKLPDSKIYTRYLSFGVVVGILVSLLMMQVIQWTSSSLFNQGKIYFISGFYLLSGVLMTQMVVWLRKHARELKSNYEHGLQDFMSKYGKLGISFFTAFVVAREGSETAIYIYSLNMEKNASGLVLALNVLVGCLAALGFSYLLNQGLKLLKTHQFMKWTGYFLLLSASGLVTSAFGQLVDENIIPGVIEPVVNIAKVVKPDSFGGSLFHFFNLNLRPSLIELSVFLIYWISVYLLTTSNRISIPRFLLRRKIHETV